LNCKKLAATALASLMAVSMIAGCGAVEKKAYEAKAIKIGVFLPLTGDNAAGGELELAGISLANKLYPEINGEKLELVVADNKSDKAEAANVAARLIEKDKVKAIIGSYGSSLAIAAGNIVKDAKIPAVGTSCTSPQVTLENDYYFRACFTDPFQGEVMANYALKQGAGRVAIIQEGSSDYAVGLANFFKEAYEKKGGQITGIYSYQTGDKDFTAILTNIKAENPDIIFAPGNFTESALLIKQARQLGITAGFMGGNSWETLDFIKIGGKDVEGIAFSSAFDSELTMTPEAKKFLEAWNKENPRQEALASNALGYDSYLIIYDAMKRAGTDDSSRLRDAIAATKDLELTTGKTSFDRNGDPVKSAVIKTVKGGKFVGIDVVNPE